MSTMTRERTQTVKEFVKAQRIELAKFERYWLDHQQDCGTKDWPAVMRSPDWAEQFSAWLATQETI